VQVYLVFASMDDLPDSFASFSRNNWKLVKEAEKDLAGTDSYKCRLGKWRQPDGPTEIVRYRYIPTDFYKCRTGEWPQPRWARITGDLKDDMRHTHGSVGRPDYMSVLDISHMLTTMTLHTQ
jgi:hypothetical protein